MTARLAACRLPIAVLLSAFDLQVRSACRSPHMIAPSWQSAQHRSKGLRCNCCRHHLRLLQHAVPAAALPLAGLTSELDALVANSQRTLIVGLTAEMERRAAVAQEASGACVVFGVQRAAPGAGAWAASWRHKSPMCDCLRQRNL